MTLMASATSLSEGIGSGDIHVFGWPEIDGLVELIAERAAERSIETIVGIARSGLVPAVMLSHTMGVRQLVVINIARTLSDDINAVKSDPQWHGISNHEALAGRRVLLIDDIVGGGMTMSMAREALRELQADVVAATLVVNKRNLGPRTVESVVDIAGCVVHGWVIFPWEGKGVVRA